MTTTRNPNTVSGNSPPQHRNPNFVSGSSPPRLLNSNEVCSLLNVHLKTLQRWVREGKIPFIRLHGRNRFRASAVEAFIRDREIRAGGAA